MIVAATQPASTRIATQMHARRNPNARAATQMHAQRLKRFKRSRRDIQERLDEAGAAARGGGRPLTPGYRTFLIEPQPGDLTWAKGRVPTPHGPVAIDWTAHTGFTLTVEVPPGTHGYTGVPSTASHGTVDGVVTAPVAVPGYPGLKGYLYFGPLNPGRHRVVAA